MGLLGKILSRNSRGKTNGSEQLKWDGDGEIETIFPPPWMTLKQFSVNVDAVVDVERTLYIALA